ncbi:MAG TPA: PmoA family protein [Opitutaceae bacterium]|nr:PmoA family protein [Opitutaceae bacterium]
MALLAAPCVSRAATDDVKLTKLADRVRVEIGGQLFTEYVFGDGASRSYCYPILAPDGVPLTRNFPMQTVAGEETDHPWQKSFWFAHSAVNGVDFWNEAGGDLGRSSANKGHTLVDGAVEATSGAIGVVRVRDRWLDTNGKLIATDERTLRFHPGADGRFIDFEITVHALPGEPLLFGDNKDGTMGTRVAQWMTMPHAITTRGADGKPVRQPGGGTGQIVTAKGVRDAAAWGTRADWCDYHATHDGKTYGIAIFDHPQNLRHPTWWMARDYGLFGANPFGWHDYEKEFANEPHKGDVTIPAGGSLTLRYRFYFHSGDEVAAKLADRYAEYAAGK